MSAAADGAHLAAPVRLASGRVAAALCVADFEQRLWSAEDVDLLAEIAASLAHEIDARLESARHEAAAEAALLATQARLLAVADNIPGIVFERKKSSDASATYTVFGARKAKLPSARAMMDGGVSGLLDFIHPDDRDRIRTALRRNTIDETDLDLKFRIAETDGRWRWLRSRSTVRRADDGAVYWDGLCFDITDLVAAREEAEAARAGKEAALVNVSHELRTPLQAILGFAEFLTRETDFEQISAHGRNIRSAAEALLSVVNQLLDRAGAEAATVRCETVNIHAFAESCLAKVEPKAVEKSLDSKLVIGPDVPEVVSIDRQKLHQVLLNLLKNAAKFTEAGGFTLRVDGAPNGLRFSVIDTGIGIPPEKRDLLFRRFSRIDSDVRSVDGTGLGLSITKTLVESMQGRIGVAGNTDRGTTFWLEIPAPARADIEKTVPSARRPEALAVDPQRSANGARILLADDLDLNRKLIADMLSIDGHSVDCVADGAAAVRAVGAKHYDLILMDMIMPGMDGIAATRAIRNLPAPACAVPIVALTANSFREQLDNCLKAGMDATLTKPMSLDALTHAVSRWTQGRNKAA